MKKSKNYNTLRTAVLALSGVVGLTAVGACSQEQETEPVLPTTVFVQKVGGRTFLQGCFTGFGNKDIAFNEVGTLTLTPEANDEWKFTFRTADNKHSRLIDVSDLDRAKVYDSGADPIYTAPKEAREDTIEHQVLCRQELLFGETLPEYAKGQFATTIVRNANGFAEHMLGPVNSKTHKVINVEGLGEHFTPVGNQEMPLGRLVL